jgi:hypothetical protein
MEFLSWANPKDSDEQRVLESSMKVSSACFHARAGVIREDNHFLPKEQMQTNDLLTFAHK